MKAYRCSCGAKPRAVKENNTHYIKCDYCGMEGTSATNCEDAVRNWNNLMCLIQLEDAYKAYDAAYVV